MMHLNGVSLGSSEAIQDLRQLQQSSASAAMAEYLDVMTSGSCSAIPKHVQQ